MPSTIGQRLPALMAALVLLVGCAATSPERVRVEESPATRPVGADPMAPGRDLDLVPRQIPAILFDALRYPYGPPAPTNCVTLAAGVRELDAVLGDDLDTAQRSAPGDDTGKRLLVSGVRSVIPYFGWLRQLTGADRRQRLAQAAFTAGAARRGYLKGLGERLGCAPPAAPTRLQ